MQQPWLAFELGMLIPISTPIITVILHAYLPEKMIYTFLFIGTMLGKLMLKFATLVKDERNLLR